LEVVLETAHHGGCGYRSVDELRIQFRHGAANSVFDGWRVRGVVVHLIAGHVSPDDSRSVFRVRFRVVVQVQYHSADLQADDGGARRVLADDGGRAPEPLAVLRPVHRAVHVCHAAHQRAETVATAPQPDRPDRDGVLRIHVSGERGHVPVRDVFRDVVPHAEQQVSRDQPGPAAAWRRDGRCQQYGGE